MPGNSDGRTVFKVINSHSLQGVRISKTRDNAGFRFGCANVGFSFGKTLTSSPRGMGIYSVLQSNSVLQSLSNSEVVMKILNITNGDGAANIIRFTSSRIAIVAGSPEQPQAY
jgi:hypothetical protein